MKRKLALISIVAAAAAQPVLAQESAEATATAVRRPSGPPERALEIGVGLGYSQGVGDVGSNSRRR